jgi:hypothetical protein
MERLRQKVLLWMVKEKDCINFMMRAVVMSFPPKILPLAISNPGW